MVRSHEILIYEEPNGVGLEIRPALGAFERKILEDNASLGAFLHGMATRAEMTFWGVSLNHESEGPAVRSRLERIAIAIRETMENNGIGIQIDTEVRVAKKVPSRVVPPMV